MKEEQSGVVRWIIVVACIGLVLSGMFIIGGIYSCRSGGGELTGLKCSDIKVIGVCEFEDKLYTLPDNMSTEQGAVYTPPLE